MTPLLDYYDSKQLLHSASEPAGQTVCGVGCHSGVASSVHEPRISGSLQEVVLAESTAFRTPAKTITYLPESCTINHGHYLTH